MAKLSQEILTTIFALQRQLAESIDESASLEWSIFEQFGETKETAIELEELQNIRERLNTSFNRLYTLLLRVLEIQPFASTAMLELLEQTIVQGNETLAGCKASIYEIERNWNHL
jgi:hypothetical protein